MKLDLKDGKAVTALVVVLLAGVLLGGALGWAVGLSRVRDLEERLATVEDELAKTAGAERETTATQEPGSTSTEPTEEGPTDSASGSEAVTERQPALVVSARAADGTDYLTLDYIQFLTGDDAADAAIAHGAESPPPNDYYIVNDNPKLREFPVASGITVRVVVNEDGTANPDGRAMALDDWLAVISGSDAQAFLANFYWVTITDGTITAIEQQYLP